MKSLFFLSAISASLLASSVSAGNMGPVIPENDWRMVGTISAGAAWANAGDTQTFFLAPQIEKTYAAKKSSNALALGELFVGAQRTFADRWQGQLGVAFSTSGNAKLQGQIWDDADPEFNNHRYNYKVRHSAIALKGKILKDCGFWLTPWVSGALGVGFNRAHGFSNTPLIFEALPNPNYRNNNNTAFSYTLGAGLQKAINEHWSFGLGYEFGDWGKSELDRAAGQTLNSGLKLNHLYTNGVLLNLSYVA